MNVATLMAKLSGVRRAVEDVLDENTARNRTRGQIQHRSNYDPDSVGHYFAQASECINRLRAVLPELYSDFQATETEPSVIMTPPGGAVRPNHFGRPQLERLGRDIDQVFEIRANSELQQPVRASPKRVFIAHGKSEDWRAVQAYLEREVAIPTVELEQQPNTGRTLIEKLFDSADACDAAVIVMTGDDVAGVEFRARENVIHEIGFFQGHYGRGRVVLLHEDGVNIPSNLSGVVYCPFPRGHIAASFYVLQRELKAIYKL